MYLNRLRKELIGDEVGQDIDCTTVNGCVSFGNEEEVNEMRTKIDTSWQKELLFPSICTL